MILYRKKKEYKKEVEIIKQAIASYEQSLVEEVLEWEQKNQKSAKLSRALAKLLGLLSAKGVPHMRIVKYQLGKKDWNWSKRKSVVDQSSALGSAAQ